jgi:hypothetical protein
MDNPAKNSSWPALRRGVALAHHVLVADSGKASLFRLWMQHESLLQPEGKRGFSRHANFLSPGE